MENLLKVDDLKTYFKTHIGDVQAVRGISLYVNKGEALKALINYLGIDKDEVIAFGDNYNDLPMLELAGIGVVMGNANDEVKEKGDYITAKNTEDGVAKAIYKFLGI